MIEYFILFSLFSCNFLVLVMLVEIGRLKKKNVLQNENVIQNSSKTESVLRLKGQLHQSRLFAEELSKHYGFLQKELDNTNIAYKRVLLETEELSTIGKLALEIYNLRFVCDYMKADEVELRLRSLCEDYNRNNQVEDSKQ